MKTEKELLCEMLLQVINENIYNVLRLGNMELNRVIKDNSYIYSLNSFQLNQIINILSNNFSLKKNVLKQYYLSLQEQECIVQETGEIQYCLDSWLQINSKQIMASISLRNLKQFINSSFFQININKQDIDSVILFRIKELINGDEVLYSSLKLACMGNLNTYFHDKKYMFKAYELACENINQQIFMLGVSQCSINKEINIPLLIYQKGNYDYVL